MQKRSFVLLACWVLSALPAKAQNVTPAVHTQARTLWTIGTSDGSSADLAIDAEDFVKYPTRFPVGPMYVVGRSNAKLDWPHVHPGPLDMWAGGRPHTFTILFALRSVPDGAAYRLVVKVLDTNRPEPPRLRIALNEFTREFQLPGGSHFMLEERPAAGAPSEVTMPIPHNALQAGDNVLTITSTAGCWLVYDALSFEGPADAVLAPASSETTILEVQPMAAVLRHRPDRSEDTQPLQLLIQHSGETTDAVLEAGDETRTPVTLHTGTHVVRAYVPTVKHKTRVPVRLQMNGRIVAQYETVLERVRSWAVYVLHHTHLDIGYTHAQPEVLEIQKQHLRQAIDLARKTADYPSEARFRWNPEGLWAVQAYLREADETEREAFLDAVRSGAIGLDALYANELTALCRPEELFELLRCARRLTTDYNLTIDSAMISDVPGYTWGLVPVLAESGVRYLSLGPNRAHRIGRTLSVWGDRPFYWYSPCGQYKVLCWMAGQGYSWFHGTSRTTERFGDRLLTSPLDGERLLTYLNQLEREGYPYDVVQLRYSIGTDNGPPDPGLSDFVRAWNQKYVYPRLVLTTTHDMCQDLEQRYGDSIPSVRGDFTPYWEDGAASSAHETALNRAAAERLVQAEVLWTLLRPAAFPAGDFEAAWRNVVLFDEHTWGSWNSISEPESAFTRRQWEIKRSFALEADRRSRELLAGATVQLMPASGAAEGFAVFNTSSWPRSELVVLPAEWTRAGDRVTDRQGRPIPSQRLSTGELAVLAEDVPALGAAVYDVAAGRAFVDDGHVQVTSTQLTNGVITMDIDPQTGCIVSLRHREIDAELVDQGHGAGLGDYLYVKGRRPDRPQRSEVLNIRVVEPGPLVATVRIEARAPGCENLTREVRLTAGCAHVEVVADLEKEKVYEPEAVYIAFPFAVAQPTVRVDLAWSIMRPEADQLPGACRNYFTAQRWVDVSNDHYGITLATLDAPLIEIRELSTDATVVGWRKQAKSSGLLYSYVMNNYWETNYRAGQPGHARLRYAIVPHRRFDAAAAKRFGLERSRPLIAVPLEEDRVPITQPPVTVAPTEVIVSRLRPSEDGQAMTVRLFNASERIQDAALCWRPDPMPRVWLSNPHEERLRSLKTPLTIPAWGIVTLRCEQPGGDAEASRHPPPIRE
jgi:alpha-mannosidase